MQTDLFIKNKKLNTSILIKKNYIATFVKNIANNNEKVFCVIDSKIKNKFNFRINDAKYFFIFFRNFFNKCRTIVFFY